MDYEYLVKTAKELPEVKKEAAKEYFDKMDKTVALINARMMEREDIIKLIGPKNEEMMKDNHANHARFIHSILHNPNPVILADSILWVLRAYQSHGFEMNYWSAQLNNWLTILKEQLSEDTFQQIQPLYYWILTNLYIFAGIAKDQTEKNELKHFTTN